MKRYKLRKLQARRQFTRDRYLVGIDPARVTHVKQIERLAGLNLYVRDSGTYTSRRRISHLGNSRLRWVLYRMASETSKYVPEIRTKYLRRRLAGQTNRSKNLVAVIPLLLGLLMALLREPRCYDERPEAVAEMRRLEAELERKHPARRTRRSPSRAKATAAWQPGPRFFDESNRRASMGKPAWATSPPDLRQENSCWSVRPGMPGAMSILGGAATPGPSRFAVRSD